LVSTVLVIAATGCSSDGVNRDEGARCPENFQPISMEVASGEQRISLSPDDLQIPIGEFLYNGASFFFVEETGFMIYFNDAPLAAQSSVPAINCVRNATKASADPGITAQGVIAMKMESPLKVLSTVKEFGFNFTDGRVKTSFVEAAEKVDYPSKAYSTDPANPSFMVKNAGSETAYEIRSRQTIPGKGTYWLSVRLTKKIN